MKKKNLKFSNERSLNFGIEKVIKTANGKIEKLQGFIEVNNQKYEAYWREDGVCLSVVGAPTLGGNRLELAALNIVSEVAFAETDFPKNLQSRAGLWYRLNSVIYNLLAQPIMLVGEIKKNDVNTSCTWTGEGLCGYSPDYDLVSIEAYQE